jgi:hypothetical protein
MTPAESREIKALINKLEPQLREAFLEAMRDWRNNVDYKTLVDALERLDLQGAIDALHIDPAVFNKYALVMQTAYVSAGSVTSTYINKAYARTSTRLAAAVARGGFLTPGNEGASVQFRFNASNPRAEQWLREYSSIRITGYTEEQISTAQRVIVEGFSKGRGPKDIATDIAGRINRVTGRREGGIVGTSSPQAAYVQNMRERLASGAPAEMRKVLKSNTLRDKRYDGTIKRAIRGEIALTDEQINTMAERYADRLIKRRAEDIARTETAAGVLSARSESYRQALEKAGLPLDAITKTWLHLGSNGKHARVQHVIMNNISVQGLTTPFSMPSGARMQHAHDPTASAGENANCRCDTAYEIDFMWGVE